MQGTTMDNTQYTNKSHEDLIKENIMMKNELNKLKISSQSPSFTNPCYDGGDAYGENGAENKKHPTLKGIFIDKSTDISLAELDFRYV